MENKTEKLEDLLYRKKYLEDIVPDLAHVKISSHVLIESYVVSPMSVKTSKTIAIPLLFIDSKTFIDNTRLQITLEIAKLEDKIRLLNTDSNE